MQKKKKKTRLFIFLIICFVLVPFLLTKGCNYTESLNQDKNSVSEPITSISEQIQPSALVYTHAHTLSLTHSRSHNAGAYAHERAHTRTHNAHVYEQNKSISKANWTGTAVPSSGYVENVYFNTSLSVEEVVNILGSITEWETDSEGVNAYFVFKDANDNFISISSIYGKYIIVSMINGSDHIDFVSDGSILGQEGFSGWTDGVRNPITFNDTAISSYGAENNKLSTLFSITPFEQSSNNNELSIGNLFTQLGNAIIIFGGAVVNIFISMEPIFWNEGPTLIFILLIASVSFGLVFWGIELLISLIGVFKTKRKKKK